MCQNDDGAVDKQKRQLYDLLQVAPDANEADIRKAYRVLALKLHPDKNPAEDAAEQFQRLQRVYEILSDPEKRTLYDETGVIPGDEEEPLFPSDGQNVYEYFREIFTKVTEEDVAAYEGVYRYGEAEQEDLRNYYNRVKGDIAEIISYIPYSEDNDILRFLEFFDSEMEAGNLKKWKKYRKSRAALEARAEGVTRREKLAKRPKKKNKSASVESGESGLAALILARKRDREKDFDSFTDALAAKYGGSASKKGGKKKKK